MHHPAHLPALQMRVAPCALGLYAPGNHFSCHHMANSFVNIGRLDGVHAPALHVVKLLGSCLSSAPLKLRWRGLASLDAPSLLKEPTVTRSKEEALDLIKVGKDRDTGCNHHWTCHTCASRLLWTLGTSTRAMRRLQLSVAPGSHNALGPCAMSCIGWLTGIP
jgi:hypothetical protein